MGERSCLAVKVGSKVSDQLISLWAINGQVYK